MILQTNKKSFTQIHFNSIRLYFVVLKTKQQQKKTAHNICIVKTVN